MHTQTRKTNVTFARAVQLDGIEKGLPAHVYSVESENDVREGMFLPDCLQTLVLIYLYSTHGSPGYSQTSTSPWEALETSLSRDRLSALVASAEASLDEILLDRTIRLLTRPDGLSETSIRDFVLHLTNRNLSHVKS